MRDLYRMRVGSVRVVPLVLLCAATSVQARTLYVDGRSEQEAPGTSPDRPLRTIQGACDVVQPGDTVVIAEGIYYGPIRLRRAGTAERPIIFRADAAARARVIISGAHPALRAGKVAWTIADESLGLYAIPFAHMPARVLSDNVDLLPYPTLEKLRSFLLSGTMPGPRHGFAFDADAERLYVRLNPKYGPTDPNRHTLCASPPTGRGDKGDYLDLPHTFTWGVLTEAPAHVVFDGLTFETPGVTALYIRGSHALVRNCRFLGCRYGVAGGPITDNDRWSTDHVSVESCEYTQHPAYADVIEVAEEYAARPDRSKFSKFLHFQRKGVDEAILDRYEYETGLTLRMGRDWSIRHNDFHDCFDALSAHSMGESQGAEIAFNRFERIADNAIETENHTADARIHHNEFIDVFMPISWQPLGGTPWPGPILVDHNLIRTSAGFADDWRKVGYPPAAFKIGAHDNNWKYWKWMKEVPKDAVSVPGAGFLVFNNTVLMPGAHFLERTNGLASRKLLNFHFFNNIIVTDPTMNKGIAMPPDTGLEFDHNLVVAPSPSSGSPREILAGPAGLVLDEVGQVGFADRDRLQFELSSTSPAIARGRKSPVASEESLDLGAVPSGRTWKSPDVGPRSTSLLIP